MPWFESKKDVRRSYHNADNQSHNFNVKPDSVPKFRAGCVYLLLASRRCLPSIGVIAVQNGGHFKFLSGLLLGVFGVILAWRFSMLAFIY